MITRMTSLSLVNKMLSTGVHPVFEFESMETLVEMHTWGAGVQIYMMLVKGVEDKKLHYSKCLAIAVKWWLMKSSPDMIERAKNLLGVGFNGIQEDPTSEEAFFLWNTLEGIATGQGNASVYAALLDLINLKCAPNKTTKYFADFVEKRGAVVKFVTAAAPAFTYEDLFKAIVNAHFLTNLSGREPMIQTQIDDEMCKPEWDPYDTLITKYTRLLTKKTGLKAGQADDGSLIANEAMIAAGATKVGPGSSIVAGAAYVGRTEIVCFNCAKKGHGYSTCEEPSATCATCSGPHCTAMHDVVAKMQAKRGAPRVRTNRSPRQQLAATRAAQSGGRTSSRAYQVDIADVAAGEDAGYDDYVSTNIEFDSGFGEGMGDDIDNTSLSAMYTRMGVTAEDREADISANMLRYAAIGQY
jgi:hypothetical protein